MVMASRCPQEFLLLIFNITHSWIYSEILGRKERHKDADSHSLGTQKGFDGDLERVKGSAHVLDFLQIVVFKYFTVEWYS